MKTLKRSCLFLTLSIFCLIYASPFSVMYSQEPDGAKKDVPVKSENLKAEEAVFSREETPKEIAEKYSKAVVLLTTLDENNEPISLGSGFVVDPIGIIVTNYHVIEDATTVWVKFPNGAHYKAEGVLGVDEEWDVAVLKLKAEGLSSVPMGDSSKLSVGERIVTIGNPKGLETTVSDGIISALRDVGDTTEKLIQFTAPISPGSSGGPLFNTKGEVVGIATAVVPPSEEAQNLNFAVPINRAKTLLTGKKTITPGEVAKGTETEVSTIVDLIKEIIAILSDKDTGKVEEYEEEEEDEEEEGEEYE